MPRSSPLPRIASALAALLVVPVAGCGTSDPQIPDAPPPSPPTKQARFPLSVQRTGGVAGFDDHLSVQADGSVLARTRTGQVSCTLDPAAVGVLNDAALKIGDTDQPSPPASRPVDGIEVLLSSGTGLVGLDDARLDEARDTVNQLLADVTGPPAERRLCH